MVVSFFGHKDTPVKIKPLLEKMLERLISENAEITFLVGTHGNFIGFAIDNKSKK